MKVLHLLGTGRPGGVESFVLQLVRDARQSEFELSVCVVGDDGPVTAALRDAGAEVFHIGGTGSGNAARAAAFGKLIGGRRHDIVHANSGGRLLRLMSKAAGSFVISHLHGLEADWMNDVQARGPGLERRVATLGSGADVIAVSSRWMQQLLIDGGVNKPVSLLRYGVDTGRFSPAERERQRAAARAALGIDGRVVGFVGRMVEQKGPRRLIELARALEDDRRTVVFAVGDGPESDSLAADSHGLRNLLVIGSTLDVPSRMAAFDVLVMPSEWEPFGIVALEAAAMGIPVVAFSVGGLSEAVEDGVTGLLVPPGDVGALADAVRLLLADDHLRKTMGDAGRARVETSFDARATSEVVFDAYRMLSNRGVGRRIANSE